MTQMEKEKRDVPSPGTIPPANVQARVEAIAGKIAQLEAELLEVTGGHLDAVVSQSGDAPILLSSARRALSESERRFRAIFDSALDAMFIFNDALRYVDANPAAAVFTRRSHAEIVGSGLGEHLRLPDAHRVQAVVDEMLQLGRASGEATVHRDDGTPVDIEYSTVANILPRQHLLVVRDVTEQHRTMHARDSLYAELERRNRGLMALNGIGLKLGKSLELHDVYKTIFNEFTYHFLESPHLAVALYEPERRHFVCDFAVVDGEVYDPKEFPPMPLGEGPTTQAFLDLEPKIVDIELLEATLPAGRIVHFGSEPSPRSGLYVPLVVNNEAIGVLSIQHYRRDAFSSVDLTLISIMANHAAAAISNARLYSQTQREIADRKRREYELAAIATLSRDLRNVDKQSTVISILLAQATAIFNAQASAVVLNGSAEQVASVSGRGEFGHLAAESLVGYDIALMGRPRLLNGPEALAGTPWAGTSGKIGGVVGVPLSAQHTRLGAVWLGLTRAVDIQDIGLLASLADIAASTLQRARLYEQVEIHAQRLTRVMDTVVVGLLLLNREGQVVIANQPAVEALALLAGVGVGERLEALGGIHLREILATPHGGAWGREIVLDDRPNQVYDIVANPVDVGNENDGWVLVIRDISHERELQHQMQRQDRLAAVGQLAAGIAHDFNNILAVIVLYVQMLQRNPHLGPGEQKRLNVVREQAQHASALVRQILDFSRMSVMERGPVNLYDLVNNTLEIWQRTLPENIRLDFVVERRNGVHLLEGGTQEDDAPADDSCADDSFTDDSFVVEGDATRLQQVLMNLALNARDAMPTGGELRIRLAHCTVSPGDAIHARDVPPGQWTVLQVEDTGAGIATEHLAHVFDPFFTTKSVGKGTGLGLAQVYGIVRQHGGQVTVDSQVGSGTAFHIYLPIIRSEQTEANILNETELPQAGAGTILLVEDNPAAREATRAILELYGYDVLEADNGAHALEVFAQQAEPIQLVLTDVMMPEMSGLELYRALSAENPELRFLFMTGYPLEEQGRRLMELGTVDWLQKPFTIQQLTEKLQNLLD